MNSSDLHPDAAGPSRQDAWRMFDRIAPRYDLLNRLLSGRRDVAWRKAMARRLRALQRAAILDLATGTGDQLFSVFDEGVDVRRGVGMDMAGKMVERGRQKASGRTYADRLEWVIGDACAIPFDDNTFDAVLISFGIRNVVDVATALGEIARVLKPGGKALILEFSLPKNPLVLKLYLFYFRHLLPWIGGLVSGDRHAYRYLNRTVESFPYGQAFCDLMTSSGLADATARPLTFGIASIYEGVKPQA